MKSKVNKDLSIIIPVLNEEKIIKKTVEKILEFLKKENIKGELLVVNNGSQDKTVPILKKIHNSVLKVLSLDIKNKGLALKEGMEKAQGKQLILIDADLWDEKFVNSCVKLLKKYDVVVGSKAISGARDLRPISSRIISKLYNLLFKISFAFKGTETHAKLAFKKSKIMPLVRECKTDGLVFDTELIIRAERAGLSKKEIPTEVQEIRPRRFSVWHQLSQVGKSYLLLIKALRLNK